MLPTTYTSASNLVSNIKVGWNLGNTFESGSTTVPYEVDIYKKSSYKTWLYLVDSYSGFQIIGSSSQSVSSAGLANISTTITSIDVNERTRTPLRFSIRLANYAIGSCGTNEIKFTISNFVITRADSVVIPINEMNASFTGTISTGGVVSVEVPVLNFSAYGLGTLANFVNATVTYTLQITQWLVPTNPISKEDWTERYYGNPVTTKAMLQKVKDKGFNAIRVPITWISHWNNANNTFDTEWLRRIKQIVDWAFEIDLIVLINIHHDGQSSWWIKAYLDTYNKDIVKARLSMYWNRIAYMFKDYDHRLVFEGMNEILDSSGSWSAPTLDEQTSLNELYQVFLNSVRATGYKNADRILSINTYGAATNYNYIQMPTDSVANRLLVQVHYYSPQDFCWYTGSGSGNTAMVNYDAVTHGALLDGLFNDLKVKFIDNGIPVIIGEFASYSKNNTAERVEHATAYISKTKAIGIKCFWWDVGGDGTRTESQITSGALLNRHNLTWWFESIPNALVAAANS